MCTVLMEQKCLPLLSNYEIIHQTYSLFINIYALKPFLEKKNHYRRFLILLQVIFLKVC